MKIYNWELGIFLPITKLRNDHDKENNTDEQRDWFGDHGVPVSYKRPPNPYEESDIPWVCINLTNKVFLFLRLKVIIVFFYGL